MFDPSQSYSSNWEVRLDSGKELVSCLYVRDRYGLTPTMSPEIPSLAPEIIKQPMESADRSAIEEEWSLWWTERLTDEHADPEGDELRRAVDLVSDEARAWMSARYTEFVQISRTNNRNVKDLVQAMSQRSPLNLKITCLPLAEKRAWRLSGGAAIVSYSFFADWAGYVDWLSRFPDQ
jgi:hypothetical protein